MDIEMQMVSNRA